MMKILDAINQMKNNQYISTSKVKLKDQDNKITDILPVIYHPTRDLSGKKTISKKSIYTNLLQKIKI